MNAVHAHLIVTHFPIVLLLVGVALLIWSYWGEVALRNAALYVLVAAAILAALAVLTGDAAEETAERLPGVTKSLIHQHEEAAELAMWITVAAGALASGARMLVAKGHGLLGPALALLLTVALGATGTVGYAAWLGGHIRHPEIVSVVGASSPGSGIEQAPIERERPRASRSHDHEHDDD